MRRILIVLAVVLAGLSLAGCQEPAPTGSVDTASPSPAATSTSAAPAKDRPFASVAALRDAAVAAGYGKCPNLEMNPPSEGPKHAAQSGSCSDSDVFAIYASAADLDSQKVLMQEIGALPTLVGTNWTIHSTTGDLTAVQRGMGGDLLEEEAAPTEEPTEDTYDPKLADFKVTLKVTKKQCFGSAGCSVSFEPNLSYIRSVDELPDEGVTSVTYEVTGTEDAFIGTLEVDGAGKVTGVDEQNVDTTSSSKKLVAKVTEVDYNEFG